MLEKVKGLIQNEEGQGMTEYGLVLGIIAVGVVGVLIAMKGKIKTLFDNVDKDLTTATTPAQ